MIIKKKKIVCAIIACFAVRVQRPCSGILQQRCYSTIHCCCCLMSETQNTAQKRALSRNVDVDAIYCITVVCRVCSTVIDSLIVMGSYSSQWTKASCCCCGNVPHGKVCSNASRKVFGGSQSRTLKCAEIIKYTITRRVRQHNTQRQGRQFDTLHSPLCNSN